jgi:hypothetical protein
LSSVRLHRLFVQQVPRQGKHAEQMAVEIVAIGGDDDGVVHRSVLHHARIDDYLGIAGRMAMQWRLAGGMRFVWAGEAGFAPNTSTEAALRLSGSGRASGLAFQTSVNLVDFAPGHGVGLVYGQAGGGWLLSPDFGNNQELLELRYQWKLSATQSIETRVRQRRDLEQRTDAARKRVDDDVYVRFTQRF